MTKTPRPPTILAIVFWTFMAWGCATSADDPDFTEMSEDDFSSARHDGDNYLRLVATRGATSGTFLLHWPKYKMPLSVYLPPPPDGLFDDSEAVSEAVRRGVSDWTGAAGEGVPSFEFVDQRGDADIPFIWAREPDGDWYIAHCAYDVNVFQLRFGVNHILVTGRWKGGRVASLEEIHMVALHEMGHALGLMGHSDSPVDIMYRSRIGSLATGISVSDRNTLHDLYEHGSRPYRGRRGRR